MKPKRPVLLWVISISLALACLLDIGTFLYFIASNNASFEINPIFLLLKNYIPNIANIIFVILFKLIINIAVIWMLWTYKPTNSHLTAYLLVLSTIVAIILQLVGSYQNVVVHQKIESSPPGTVHPLSTPQAYSLWNSILVWYGIFILFQSGVFFLYERLFRVKH